MKDLMPADEGVKGRLRLSGWVSLDPTLVCTDSSIAQPIRAVGTSVGSRGHLFPPVHTCFGVLVGLAAVACRSVEAAWMLVFAPVARESPHRSA